MNRFAIPLLTLCLLSVSGLSGAQEPYRFTVPERGWSIELNLPALDQYQAQSENGRFKLMAHSADSGLIVSVFVEPTEAKSSQECRTEFWAKGSRNPAISKETVELTDLGRNPSVKYVINATYEGQQVSGQNTNTYIFHEKTCIDVHLSAFPARESGFDTLSSIALTASVEPNQ